MSWLTKFLGFDDALLAVREAQSKESDAKLDQLIFLMEQNEKKDQEIKRLTDLMLVEHGVIRPKVFTGPAQEKQQPINKRASWLQLQKQYENADKLINKQQDGDIAEYWIKKNQEALNEL